MEEGVKEVEGHTVQQEQLSQEEQPEHLSHVHGDMMIVWESCWVDCCVFGMDAYSTLLWDRKERRVRKGRLLLYWRREEQHVTRLTPITKLQAPSSNLRMSTAR